MITPTIALALVLAPPTPTDRPGFEVADLEVEQTETAAHLTTYDSEGEVSGEFVLWSEPTGVRHLDVNFADGVYLSVTVNGEHASSESNNPAEAAARMVALQTALPDINISVEDAVACAGTIALAGFDCTTPVIWVACVPSLAWAAIECAPVVEELVEALVE